MNHSLADLPFKSIFLAFFLYSAAHLLRSMRFWFLFNDSRFSLRTIFSVHQITASIGGFGFGGLGEILRLMVLSFLSGGCWLKVGLITLLCRLFDITVLSVPLLVWNSPSFLKISYSDMNLLVISVATMCILFLIFTSENIIAYLKRVLILKWQYRASIKPVYFLDQLQNSLRAVTGKSLTLIVFNLILTVSIWALDCVTVKVLFAGSATNPFKGFHEIVITWAQRSYLNILQSEIDASSDFFAGIQSGLLYPQIVLSCLIVVIWLLVRLMSRHGTVRGLKNA